jgi:1,2-dihydroxy-3-keto-5-methylthiopentene dioxygenase
MSKLTICRAADAAPLETIADHATIAARLASKDVRFERWAADRPLAPDAGQDEVLAAYAGPVAELNAEYGFRSLDVVSLDPDHPNRAELRQKFLAEHTHADFEVRFFVDGSGLFYLHLGDEVWMVLCEKGDLISVPADTTHWFDMGERPHFKCIRFFTVPDGWVGDFTGSDIASRFPSFDQHRAARAT